MSKSEYKRVCIQSDCAVRSELCEQLSNAQDKIKELDGKLDISFKLIGGNLYSSRQKNKSLWSTENPYDCCASDNENFEAVYHLHEDILCQQEDIEELCGGLNVALDIIEKETNGNDYSNFRGKYRALVNKVRGEE